MANGVGFSEDDGGVPLKYGLRWANNLTLDEIVSVDSDLASLVYSDNDSRAFLANTDNGRLLCFEDTDRVVS